MKKFKKDEAGFSVIEIVLVLVIIGLIGVVGWMVYKNHHKTTTASVVTTASTNKPPSTITPTKPATTPASTPSQPSTTTYSKVPVDLQTAFITQLKIDASSCVKNNQPVDFQGNPIDPRVDYDPSGFAGAGIGCDSGSWGLFAKVNGSWQFLAKTQFMYKCDILVQYHYPKQLLALNDPDPRCLDSNNNVQKYDG